MVAQHRPQRLVSWLLVPLEGEVSRWPVYPYLSTVDELRGTRSLLASNSCHKPLSTAASIGHHILHTGRAW